MKPNESERIAKQLREEATVKDGVIRWNSNGNVPPADLVLIAESLGLAVDVDKSTKAREADLDVFFAQYREAQKNKTAEQRAEEEYEMRAAFGPGETVVNIITGERFTT